MLNVDVAVIGAGPAGCAAAITLGRSGRYVILADKANFPRDKCCGDGLTTLALRELESLGLRPETVESWTPVQDVCLHSPSGRQIKLRMPDGRGQFSVVARRLDLDAALVDTTRRLGANVELRMGAALVGIACSEAGATLEFGDGEIVQARHVVAADGMWSPTRRLLTTDARTHYRGNLHAFRQYFRNVGPTAQQSLHVLFERDLLPAYAWCFPLHGSGANVGFGILRGGRIAVGDMRPLWKNLLQRTRLLEILGPEAEPEFPFQSWPIPAQLGVVPLQIGPVSFVGDAAALTDPLTGEGIGQALMSGRLAAEGILQGTNYENATRQAMALDHRLAHWLGRALTNRTFAEAALWSVDRSDWTRRNFARWMFEDYPRAVLATPRRWRRDVFSRRGAYSDVT